MLYPKLESRGGGCSADMDRDGVLHGMAPELPELELAPIGEERTGA